jgi:hypothetical protein
MALRVIGAGFGRTGTLSLRVALARLGVSPCEHMVNVIDQPERFLLWQTALAQKTRGGAIDWLPLFAGYEATVDWPGTFFWRELANAHPRARIILTVRDADAWYESTRRTIYRLRRVLGPPPVTAALATAAAALDPRIAAAIRVTDGAIWHGTFGGSFEDRAHALDVFAAHNAAVERTIAPDRLLVFDVRDGWEPLCGFLGAPVPDEPFPHLNDGADFERRVRRRLLPAAAATVGGLALAAGGAIAVGRSAARAARIPRAGGSPAERRRR